MKKSRREFLKNSCRALTMTAVATQMRHFGAVNVLAQEARDAQAAGGDYKALVCIFLNGGNDGNNTTIPNYNEGYQLYANARQAQGLAIARTSLLPITPPSMGGQDWGLHPSLLAIHPLFGSGKMAIVQNVGCLTQPLTRTTYQAGAPRPYQLFSHPDQVEQARTAISSYKSTTGWVAASRIGQARSTRAAVFRWSHRSRVPRSLISELIPRRLWSVPLRRRSIRCSPFPDLGPRPTRSPAGLR